jgi:plastocyanin
MPRRLLSLLAGLLGSGLVILPVAANSEVHPTVNALAESGMYSYPRWSPKEVAVMPAGGITFTNGSTTVPHGIVWVAAAPTCDASVPVGKGNFKPNWTGNCTFAQAGEYKYYCSYHGPSMSGTVFVNASGTVPPPPPPEKESPPPGKEPAPKNEPPPRGNEPPPSSPGGPTVLSGVLGSTQLGSSQGGSAGALSTPSNARPFGTLALARSQSGSSVRGSIKISQAGAGGRLMVELFAKGASLARTGRSAQVLVGRLVRSSVRAGTVSFSVTLSAKAKRTLLRRRRLALTVKIVLEPAHGAATIVTRAVVVRAR